MPPNCEYRSRFVYRQIPGSLDAARIECPVGFGTWILGRVRGHALPPISSGWKSFQYRAQQQAPHAILKKVGDDPRSQAPPLLGEQTE